MSPIRYDAVIATRNRPEALALSIPALIHQSRPPTKLIVIDASDDHGAVVDAVGQATRGWAGHVALFRGPAGLTHQRNLGLKHVEAPVVFFPDDDAIFHPEAAAEIMAIYERDHGGAVAAVSAAETGVIPGSGVLDAAPQAFRLGWGGLVVQALRRHLERRFPVLKPSLILGKTLNGRHPLPPWLEEMQACPVEYMTGFRMTFRTDAIRAAGFDEAFADYCLEEDVDASFTAMRSGLVLGANRAKVYHHRWPSRRGDPFALGRMEIRNRAHVLLKHADGPSGSPTLARTMWRFHLGFTALKALSLLPRLHRTETRARLAGAWAGHRDAVRTWKARPGAGRRPATTITPT